MEWKHYFAKVVQRHKVIVEGWPNAIPFKNLGEGSGVLAELENLLEMWQTGMTYWKAITEDELRVLENKRQQEIDAGNILAPVERRRRSDYGQKRKRTSNGDSEDGNHQPRRASKKSKSTETIESEDDAPSHVTDTGETTVQTSSTNGECATIIHPHPLQLSS